MSSDPFDALQLPDEAIRPPAAFVTRLRAELAASLGIEPEPPADHRAHDPAASRPGDPLSGPSDEPGSVPLPPRRPAMTPVTTTLTPSTASDVSSGPPDGAVGAAARLTPYLVVHDGAAALAFYTAAFGAVEVLRVADDTGRLGHAELALGPARIYLSDEYPDLGVVSPRTLGGAGVTLHLEVADVDRAFAAAVAAGATIQQPPADQPHGARHGTLTDPFGHRWMLSQTVETVSAATLAQRLEGSGFTVVAGADPAPAGSEAPEGAGARSGPGGIWAAIGAYDAPALIGFLVDVFGFEAALVVPGEEPAVVAHSEMRWPEGGTIQVSSAGRPGSMFSQRPVGNENIYVVTADPDPVYRRCRAAGVTVLLEPAAPDYDPGGTMFTVADPEGNLWTFGTYAGEP